MITMSNAMDHGRCFTRVLENSLAAESSGSREEIIKAFCDDAEKFRGDPEKHLASKFSQFIVGATAASDALTRHDLNEAGQWLLWSIAEPIVQGPKQSIKIGRLVEFLDPTITAWDNFAPIYVGWFGNFYYYANNRGAVPDIAGEILPVAIRVINFMWSNPVTENTARATSYVMAWCAQHRLEEAVEISRLVQAEAQNSKNHERVRLVLAMTLAGRVGELVGVNPQHWRSIALNDFAASHVEHERLQLLVDELGSRDDQELYQKVLAEIDAYQCNAGNHGANEVDKLRGVDALAPLLKVALHACLSRHQPHRVVELLARWYRVPMDVVFDVEELLLQYPFHHQGHLSLLSTHVFQDEGDPGELLVALTNASNSFLSTFTSVTDSAKPVDVNDPTRPGVVIESAATRYELLLRQTYLPRDLASQEWSFSGQAAVPGKGHPVQAIQVRSGWKTAPIIASLQKPHTDRPVRRVALWSAAGTMTEEAERLAVAGAFRRAGVRVDIVEPDRATVDGFLDCYGSAEPDVIWLMSHGNFDHYSPKRASLMIGEGTCDGAGDVGISQLLERAPVSEQRRLCVLNVCDGGRFEEHGVLPRVGVAAAAASAAQATISHLWPVHGISAAVFGVLLAGNLVESSSYFEAFEETLRQLDAPASELMDRLSEAAGEDAAELIQRVERSNIDFASMAHWGSAVFYC